MTRLVQELKVRARLRLNARRESEPALRLRDCLHDVARAAGFRHWEQGRRVLGGEAGRATTSATSGTRLAATAS